MKKKKTRRATRAFYAGLSYLSPRWNTQLLYLRKFGRLPDLILLDGGKGHVAAVKPVLESIGLGDIRSSVW